MDPKLATGVAPIAVTSDGENSIIIVPGANDELTTAEIEYGNLRLPPAPLSLCFILSHVLAHIQLALPLSLSVLVPPG